MMPLDFRSTIESFRENINRTRQQAFGDIGAFPHTEPPNRADVSFPLVRFFHGFNQ